MYRGVSQADRISQHCRVRESDMSLLKYFFAKKKDSDDNLRLPDVTWTASTTLSEEDLRSANESIEKARSGYAFL